MSSVGYNNNFSGSNGGHNHLINQPGAHNCIPAPRYGGAPPPGQPMCGYPQGYGQGPNYQGGGGGHGQVNASQTVKAPQGSSLFRKHMVDYFTNQKVQVNITGYGWLLGSVVAFVNIAQAVTGTGVKVRYVKVNQEEEEEVFPNDPAYIRPASY